MNKEVIISKIVVPIVTLVCGIVLYTIKLLKIILEDCEHYICIKILSNELCNLIISIFKENLKKNNLITSCLMSFFNSISQNDIYILNIIIFY